MAQVILNAKFKAMSAYMEKSEIFLGIFPSEAQRERKTKDQDRR